MSLWQKVLIKENCSDNSMLGYFERFVWSMLLTLCTQTTKYIFKKKVQNDQCLLYALRKLSCFSWNYCLQPVCRFKILFVICNFSRYKEQWRQIHERGITEVNFPRMIVEEKVISFKWENAEWWSLLQWESTEMAYGEMRKMLLASLDVFRLLQFLGIGLSSIGGPFQSCVPIIW